MCPVRVSAIAYFAIVAGSSLVSLTGCAETVFGGAAPGYDQQACLERALRRSPDPDTVERATQAFKKECREGGPEACSALGVMNEIGVGVPLNAARAVVLYDRACRAGNARGCTNLGVALVGGIGVSRDALAGARLLEPACAQNDARACLHLGRLYESGDGAAKDPIYAAKLFETACIGEEAPACIALGDARAKTGQRSSALDFYDKACSLGYAEGCARLEAPAAPSRKLIASNAR